MEPTAAIQLPFNTVEKPFSVTKQEHQEASKKRPGRPKGTTQKKPKKAITDDEVLQQPPVLKRTHAMSSLPMEKTIDLTQSSDEEEEDEYEVGSFVSDDLEGEEDPDTIIEWSFLWSIHEPLMIFLKQRANLHRLGAFGATRPELTIAMMDQIYCMFDEVITKNPKYNGEYKIN